MWLCFPCRLLSGLVQECLCCKLPNSPEPDSWPSSLHRALSPSLSETAPSHERSFCGIVWVWPFLFKDSKGKSCSKALHNHVLFTQSLCAQIILLNNDSSLHLQQQGNVTLTSKHNPMGKAQKCQPFKNTLRKACVPFSDATDDQENF